MRKKATEILMGNSGNQEASRRISGQSTFGKIMKALLIAMGLIFILGGIKDVNDPRPSLVTMGGIHVSTGYHQPLSAQEGQPTHYLGYASIGFGILTIFAGIFSKSLFSSRAVLNK